MANRAQYSDEVKWVVKAKYPLCKSPADRERLAAECDIDSIQKLYNLASRLLATRPHATSAIEWVGEDEGYDATQDTSRWYLRDDPETLVWTADDDRYLREHFGKTEIESIGFFLNRTETACAYRARQLALRNIPKYYDVRKVAAWLGLSLREMFQMPKTHGLQLFPCTDSTGKLKITLVSTTSLVRALLKDQFWKLLVDKRDADQYFISDVIESVASLMREEVSWEPNAWVSHGHTCLNPFSEDCFGWFYNGYDDKMSGSDLDPRDLAPSANVASDNWLRGRAARVQFDEEVTQLRAEIEAHEQGPVAPVAT